VTPGPIAVNAATYVGYNYAGFAGAAVATVGVTLPSFLLVLAVIQFMRKFEESKAMTAVLQGIRPAAVGLIASAVIFLAETSILNGPVFSIRLITDAAEYFNLLPCAIFLGTIILAGKFKAGPILLTVAAGVIGALVIR
jgi:chromate transporter